LETRVAALNSPHRTVDVNSRRPVCSGFVTQHKFMTPLVECDEKLTKLSHFKCTTPAER